MQSINFLIHNSNMTNLVQSQSVVHSFRLFSLPVKNNQIPDLNKLHNVSFQRESHKQILNLLNKFTVYYSKFQKDNMCIKGFFLI